MNDSTQNDKRKRAHESETTQRTGNVTVGETLRQARLQRRLALEEISSAIHVRVGQLRAIEEGNIDSLPGMTYAVGFVKSYADFLKLNSVEIANRFKAEHGALKPVMPDLQAPQPIVENRRPDPMLVGVGAFFAIGILVVWSIFGGNDDDTKVADIQAPPVEEMPLTAATTGGTVTDPDALPQGSADGDAVMTADAAKTVGASDASSNATTSATTATATPAIPAEAAAASETPAAAAETPKAVEETKVVETTKATPTTQVPEVEDAAPVPVNRDVKAVYGTTLSDRKKMNDRDGVINIRKPAGRVTLRARQSSWVQITDAQGNVVFKKVMRPGESVGVPDEPGLSLVTSNAGGFDIYVDGQQAPSIGKSGEIVSGIALNPASLKKQHMRGQLNN